MEVVSPFNKGLKKALGVGFGVAIGVGGTIGVGILRKPAEVAYHIHNVYCIIFLWLIIGFISLVGGMIYAEVGTRFPETGGPFVFAKHAFGDFIGYMVGWSDWIFTAGTVSFIAISFGEYFNQFFHTRLSVAFLSSLAVLIFAYMQWFGIHFSSMLQKVLSGLKTIGFIIFFIACFYFWYTSQPETVAMENHSNDFLLFNGIASIIISLRAIYITYSGWNSVIYFTEEDKNPLENIPKSIRLGIYTVMGIYILMNLALLSVLSLKQIAGSDLPAADAMQLIFGEKGYDIVLGISLISLLGILYANQLYAPRIIYAMSRNQLFYKKAGHLNDHHSPGIALIATVSVILLFCLTGAFQLVINISSMLGILVDLSVYVSFMLLRRRYGIQMNHYKTSFYPWNGILMIVITIGLAMGLLISDFSNSIMALTIVLIGFLVYLWHQNLEKKELNHK